MEKSKPRHHTNMRIALFSFLIMTNVMAFGQGSISTHVKDSLKREDSIIMSKVVQMPEFAEGEDKLIHNISKGIGMIDLDDSIVDYSSTRIVLRFIINEDSSISDIYVYKSFYHKIDKQVVEIARNLGKFKPALDKDMKPVKAVIVLPIQLCFRKNDD